MKVQGKNRAVVETEKAQAELDAKRTAILAELEMLSRRLPRHIEDLRELTGGYPTGVDAAEAGEISNRKAELRNLLRMLV